MKSIIRLTAVMALTSAALLSPQKVVAQCNNCTDAYGGGGLIEHACVDWGTADVACFHSNFKPGTCGRFHTVSCNVTKAITDFAEDLEKVGLPKGAVERVASSGQYILLQEDRRSMVVLNCGGEFVTEVALNEAQWAVARASNVAQDVVAPPS